MSKFKRYERYKDSGVEWIGEIPEHWGVIKLKYVTKLAYGDSLPTENREEEGEVDVFGSNGKVGTHNVANTLSPVIIVGRKGSYGKVTYSDKKCFAIDTTYYIDNGCTKSNIKWLYYSLMVLELDKNSQDTGVPGLSREYAYNKYVPVPTVNEQVAIANFLDQKTAEIDGLIADKEKLIELLQEKRQAVITEAVTKGLNPNVRLKDSGIEWIGEIPEHWNVEPIKYMVKTIQTGTTPTTKNDDYFDGDIQWFTPGDFHGSKELYEASRKISNLAVIDNEARLFPKNTVMIVGIGATVGKVAKLGVEGSFNQQITGLIVNEQRLNCDYLYYWLYINQETIKNISNYTTLPIINNEFVKNFECLSLPLDEQQAIVNYLNQKTSEIDDLMLKIRLQIQKLKEYRQSLISEAVTGKIDVREFGSISEVI